MAEERDLPPSTPWEVLPPEAKETVYAHLRALISQANKGAAEARLLMSFTSEAAREPAFCIEQTQRGVAASLEAAIVELELADPDRCPDCGGYHDEQVIHPKDLS